MSVNSQLVGVGASTRKAIARSRRMRRAAPTRHEISQFFICNHGTALHVYGKKTPGGAGTHTGHAAHTGTQASFLLMGTRIAQTNLSTTQPSKPTPTPPHVRATTESAADSTAAAPKPTAPRGFLLDTS